jgi:hypothetical protein
MFTSFSENMLPPYSGWKSNPNMVKGDTDIGIRVNQRGALSEPTGVQRRVKESETCERTILLEKWL